MNWPNVFRTEVEGLVGDERAQVVVEMVAVL